jgi:hypothetical protein
LMELVACLTAQEYERSNIEKNEFPELSTLSSQSTF